MGLTAGDTVTITYPPDEEVPYWSMVQGPITQVLSADLVIVAPVWFRADGESWVEYDGVKHLLARVTSSGLDPIDARDLPALIAVLRKAWGLQDA